MLIILQYFLENYSISLLPLSLNMFAVSLNSFRNSPFLILALKSLTNILTWCYPIVRHPVSYSIIEYLLILDFFFWKVYICYRYIFAPRNYIAQHFMVCLIFTYLYPPENPFPALVSAYEIDIIITTVSNIPLLCLLEGQHFYLITFCIYPCSDIAPS